MADANQAFEDLCDEFYYAGVGLDSYTFKNIYCAFDTSYRALERTVAGIDGLYADFGWHGLLAYATIDETEPGLWVYDNMRKQEAHMTEWLESDDEEEDQLAKEVKEALRGRDLSNMDDSLRAMMQEMQSWTEAHYKRVDNFKPITIGLQRALEFWEWWLTEAIAEAWARVER